MNHRKEDRFSGSVAVKSRTITTKALRTLLAPRNLLRRNGIDIQASIFVGLVSFLAQWINLFHYPYFFDDEGTYVSQAWAVIHLHQLAPYTYWYDHSPVGWLQLAGWYQLTGGFTTFGSPLVSGRILMTIFQVGTTIMLYLIVRRTTDSIGAGVLAALLFALSPYGIYYHRRIYIDNIATFWMILSLAMLMVPQRLTLRRIWLSALAFGIAVLTKENVVFLFPVLPLIVYFRAHSIHRGLAVLGWIVVALSVISLYFCMAILKDELLPTGVLPGDTAPHVSLLGSLAYQSSRGRDGGFLNPHSSIWNLIHQWIFSDSAPGENPPGDPILVIGGTVYAVLSLVIYRWNRIIALMGGATLLMWFFLGRGGITIGFYLVPLLPLLAINIGVLAGFVFKRVTHSMVIHRRSGVRRIMSQGLLMVIIGATTLASPWVIAQGFGYNNATLPALYTRDQTTGQTQALKWIAQNVPDHSRIIFDDFAYTDLQLMHKGLVLYYYWKVDFDPAIHDTALHDDWNNVDYLLITPQVTTDLHNNPMPLLQTVLDHALPVVEFNSDQWSVQIYRVVHRVSITDNHPSDINMPPILLTHPRRPKFAPPP